MDGSWPSYCAGIRTFNAPASIPAAGCSKPPANASTRRDLNAAQVEFVHADVLQWPAPTAAYDLVVTHFVLDCFRPEQLALVLPALAAAATPEARWLLADFREPSTGLAKWRARAILELMYLFFRWAASLPASELTAPDPLLAQCGFKLRERRTFEWGLLHSDLWVGQGAS